MRRQTSSGAGNTWPPWARLSRTPVFFRRLSPDNGGYKPVAKMVVRPIRGRATNFRTGKPLKTMHRPSRKLRACPRISRAGYFYHRLLSEASWWPRRPAPTRWNRHSNAVSGPFEPWHFCGPGQVDSLNRSSQCPDRTFAKEFRNTPKSGSSAAASPFPLRFRD